MNLKLALAACGFALPVVLLPLAGCSGEGKQKTTRRGAANEEDNSGSGGGNAPVASGGAFPTAQATATIKGVAKWQGDLPKGKKLPIAGDDFCIKCYPDGFPIRQREEINAANKGVPNVFIEIKGASKWKFDVPSEPVKINQINCMYVPHVVGIVKGQTVEVTSSDQATHNVHLISRRNGGNNFTQAKGQVDKLVFKRAEDKAYLKCDIHGWMKCWTFVKDHALFAVSDKDGNFTLPKLPAGDYEVIAWHENKKWKTEPVKVTVGDGATKEIEIKVSKK